MTTEDVKVRAAVRSLVDSAPLPPPFPAARQGDRHRRRSASLALVFLTIAAVMGVIILAVRDGKEVAGVTGESTELAKESPRVLVGDPSWSVTYADISAGDHGELTFSDGIHELGLHWYRAEYYREYLEDRSEQGRNPPVETFVVLGRQATMFQTADTTDFTTMLAPLGSTFLEIRGDLGHKDRYMRILRSLEEVDEETWLAAMPPSAVRPIDRASAVDEMLRDLPIPSEVDIESLRSGDPVSDRYQLGAQVAGAVACGWFERWTAARQSGNAEAASEAVEAMRTSRNWPILKWMDDRGDYPEVVWEYSERMASGELSREEYAPGLGCDAS